MIDLKLFAFTSEDYACGNNYIAQLHNDAGRQLTADEMTRAIIQNRHDTLIPRLIEAGAAELMLAKGGRAVLGPKIRMAWKEIATMNDLLVSFEKAGKDARIMQFFSDVRGVYEGIAKIVSTDHLTFQRNAMYASAYKLPNPRDRASALRLCSSLDHLIQEAVKEFPYCLHPYADKLEKEMSIIPQEYKEEERPLNYRELMRLAKEEEEEIALRENGQLQRPSE